jgi:signal transduction histidine kinase
MLELPTGTQMLNANAKVEASDTRMANAGRISIAHDLNNLLTPVIWTLATLQEKQVGAPTQRRRVEGAIACADRAQSLVRQLADTWASRQLDLTLVCIPGMLSNLEKVFLCALGPRIKLVFNIAPALPAVLIDRERIERALLNLIVNARESIADGGTVTVSAHMEARPADRPSEANRKLHISIRDTGAGMDAATLRQAVTPFFSTKPDGSGLGLAVTRDLIECLNGDMTIKSAPGIGTTIDMWLPIA